MLPGYEGLVHVSELDNKKIASPEAAGFVSGQMIDVKYLGKNDKVIFFLVDKFRAWNRFFFAILIIRSTLFSFKLSS